MGVSYAVSADLAREIGCKFFVRSSDRSALVCEMRPQRLIDATGLDPAGKLAWPETIANFTHSTLQMNSFFPSIAQRRDFPSVSASVYKVKSGARLFRCQRTLWKGARAMAKAIS